MLGLSAGQVRSYASKGFLTPDRGTRGELRFGFQDLVILRTAGELTAAHIPQRKVRRVLERLREQLPDDTSLAAVRIAADGERVVVSDGDAVWNPESGQALFDFAVSEIVEKSAAIDERFTANERDADQWFDIAGDLEGSDDEGARNAYERCIELDPAHADAHVNLGRLLHEASAPAAAEKHYRAALVADPEHPTAAFNLGVALEDLGKFGEAIDAYQQALKLDPENADAYYNLAGIYERKGDKAAVVRNLTMYRKLRG